MCNLQESQLSYVLITVTLPLAASTTMVLVAGVV